MNLPASWWRCPAALVFSGLIIGLCSVSPNPNAAMQAGVSLDLPDSVLGMSGTTEGMTVAEQKILPTDTQFARKEYRSAEGDQIFCSVVLAGGEKRSIHRPEICLPGQGWTIKSGEVVPLTMADGRKLSVMKLNLEREEQVGPDRRIKINSVFMYWFVGKGVTTPYHWRRVFLTSWDRVVRGVNHRWAYVVVTATVTKGLVVGGKDEMQTQELLKSFISKMAPAIMVEQSGSTPH